jgi:mRNA interferase HigB
MRVIARRTLREFWERQPQAERSIRAWFAVVAQARWHDPNDIKRQFGTTVDFVADNRVIFDLGGNKYRLVVHVSYAFGRILVKFIGTHAEYDRIDPETVTWRGRRSGPSATKRNMKRR